MVDEDEQIEQALNLLEYIDYDELTVKEVFDRLEVVTKDAHLQNRILEVATDRGIIEREGDTYALSRSGSEGFESSVVRKEGEFTCDRCDKGITEGYFLKIGDAEHGPYGSTCIRKVTGRE